MLVPRGLNRKEIKMVYFYCCEVNLEGKPVRLDGVIELEKGIQSTENAMNVFSYAKRNIIGEIRKKIPNISLNEEQMVFLAFNPL